MGVKDHLQQIGVFSTTHGIAGALKLRLEQDYYLLQPLTAIALFSEDTKGTLTAWTVTRQFFQGDKIIVNLQGIDSINAAQALVNTKCYVVDDVLTIIGQDINFIGYDVYENGIHIGSVIDTMQTAAYESFKVKTDVRTFWVPNVDRYVIALDEATKTITIQNSEVLA